MKHSRGRVIDITTLADLDHRLATGVRSLAGWRVVGLDRHLGAQPVHRQALRQRIPAVGGDVEQDRVRFAPQEQVEQPQEDVQHDERAEGDPLARPHAQSLFLGCTFADGDDDAVRRAGGVVLHEIAGIPVDPYRATLYSPGDLYDTSPYEATLDARAYAWSRRSTGRATSRSTWATSSTPSPGS